MHLAGAHPPCSRKGPLLPACGLKRPRRVKREATNSHFCGLGDSAIFSVDSTVRPDLKRVSDSQTIECNVVRGRRGPLPPRRARYRSFHELRFPSGFGLFPGCVWSVVHRHRPTRRQVGFKHVCELSKNKILAAYPVRACVYHRLTEPLEQHSRTSGTEGARGTRGPRPAAGYTTPPVRGLYQPAVSTFLS